MNDLSLRLALVTLEKSEMWSPKLQGKFRPLLQPWAPVQDWSKVGMMVAPTCNQPPALPVAGIPAAEQWDAVAGWGHFLFCLLLHRPQGACGCRIIINLFIGEEKYKHKSCTQNSCMLLARMFFLLVLDTVPFSTEQKGFSELFNFICLCDSVKLVLNLEGKKMCIQHY